mgnify:CR=1 FL=1
MLDISGLVLTTGPTTEPVTLEEAKQHLRLEVSDDDDYVTGLIVAARLLVERMQKRALYTQTYTLKLDDFPGDEFRVPRPPLQSVSSITYLDTSGVSQTLATSIYGVDTSSEPGRIYLKYGQTWPNVYYDPFAVTITYLAGYSTVAAIPATTKQAIKMWAAHLYEERTPVTSVSANALPFALESLIAVDAAGWIW